MRPRMSRVSAPSFTAPTSVPSGTSAHDAPGRSATHQKVMAVPFAVARTPPGATFAATAAAISDGTGSVCVAPERAGAWLITSVRMARSMMSMSNGECRVFGIQRSAFAIDLIREGAEEGRALVGIAPLRTEHPGAELVLIGRPHLGAIHLRQRIEPLLVAAARVVI